MKFLALYEKIQLKIDKLEIINDKNKKLSSRLFSFSKLFFYKIQISIIKVLSLFLGDSSDNYLLFTKLSTGSVLVCNNSFCQYKKFQKKVRYFSKTAFSMILITTILTSSILYYMMPNKPSSYAASFNWVQSDWSGSNTVNNANHTSNKTNWTEYSAKDSNVSASTTVSLSSTSTADIQSGLVGDWNFDETSGIIAGDSSVNGNDGTLGVNINLNSGLETFTGTKDDAVADSFTNWAPNLATSLAVSDSAVGTTALKLKYSGSGDNFLVSDGISPVGGVAGKKYTLSFWGKATANTVVANNALQSYGPDWSVAEYLGTGSLNFTTEWQEFTYTTTFTNVNDTFRVVLRSSDNTGIDVFYDDVQIMQSSPTWVAGQTGYGNALDFNGTDELVNISDDNSLDITGDITISAWIKVDSFPSIIGEIATKWSTIGGYSYLFDIEPAGKIRFFTSADGSTYENSYVISDEVIPLDTWAHVLGVSNGTTMKVYIDGTEDPNTNGSPALAGSIYSGGASLGIGGVYYTAEPSFFLDGKLDEVKIYNRALTDTEITALYGNSNLGNTQTSNADFSAGDTTDSIVVSGGNITMSTAPDQVTGLTVTGNASGQITLNWTVPADNGSTLTGYYIYRGTTSDTYGAPINTGNTSISYTDSGLTNGTTYYYRISAYNARGEGIQSDEMDGVAGYLTATGCSGYLAAWAVSPTQTIWGPDTLCVSPQCVGNYFSTDNTVDYSAHPGRNYCKSIGGRASSQAEIVCIYNAGMSLGTGVWTNYQSSANYTGEVWANGIGDGERKSGNNQIYCVKDFTSSPSSVNFSPSATSISSTYTSPAIDLGLTPSSLNNLSWNATVPTGTTLKFQMRSATTSGGLTSATWYGPTGTGDYYTTSSTAINSVHNGHRYVQYKAFFTSSDQTQTPTLGDITIGYNYYPASQTLTSSAYDTTDSAVVANNLAWSESLPAGTNIKFQIRTAPNLASVPDWINGSTWCGPTTCAATTGDTDYATDYYETTSAGEVINSTQRDGINDQWIQYKVWLISDGSATPILSQIDIQYVVNATPVISNVTASQGADGIITASYDLVDADSSSLTVSILADTGISLNEELTNSDATAITLSNASFLPVSGTVQIGDEQISYTSKANNDLTGTIIRGANNTTALAHTSGSAVWVKGTTVSGDIGASQTVGTNKSIAWTIKDDLDGIYYTTAKIRVSANDGQPANQVGNGDTLTFILDTKDPSLGANPILIDASGGLDSVTLTIDASDDIIGTFQMKASNDSGLLADGINADSGTWISYASSKPWIFDTDPDTVYIQFKDEKGNTSTIQSLQSLASPLNFMIQDTSNLAALEFREFIAWKSSTIPNFQDYTLESSTDNITFSTLDTQTAQATNFFTHNSLTQDQDYYYRVYQQDTLGNKSIRTNSIHGQANAVQDFDEGGGGTEGDAPVITHSYLQKTTSASEASIKIFWSNDTTLTSFNHYEIWYGENLIDVQNKSGTALKWDNNNDANLLAETTNLSTITGLTESTNYYFKIWAIDDDFSTQVPTSISTATNTTATISFETNDLSSSFIAYSIGTDFSSASEQGTLTMITTNNFHTVTIIGLSENTQYYYRIRSANASGTSGYLPLSDALTIEKQKYTFTTTSDITPPTVSSGPSVVTTADTATITFSSNESSSYRIDYGTDILLVDENALCNVGSCVISSSLNTLHTADITTGLLENTTYLYKITLTDSNNNSATYDNSGVGYSFQTLTSTDVTAPVITPTGSISITSTTAIITWDTNEGANSRIDYGTDLDTDNIPIYTNIQGNNTTYTTTTGHSIELGGLAVGTTYYYRIRSSDRYGNIGTKNSTGNPILYFNFTTDGTSNPADTTLPTITYVSKTFDYNSANITFQVSDELGSARALIGYNVFVEGSNSYKNEISANEDIASGSQYTLTLNGLASETSYIIRLQAQDSAGNKSAWLTDETSGSNLRFTTLSGSSNPIPDITFSFPSGITNITSSSAKISWETDLLSNSLIDYSLTDNTFTSTLGKYNDSTKSHYILLANLSPGQTYYFRIRSVTNAGVDAKLVNNDGNGFYFTTTTGFDETAPIISAVEDTITSPTTTTGTITWTTNEFSSSIVEYGTSASSLSKTKGNKSELVLEHNITLTGLIPSTPYYYRVKSIDVSGNVAISSYNVNGDNYTFSTALVSETETDFTPPVIVFTASSDITNITSNSAVIYWTTDDISDSSIIYGVDTTSFNFEEGSSGLITSHKTTLSNLSPSTIYNFKINSRNAAGLLATDDNSPTGYYSFTTLANIDDKAKPIISYENSVLVNANDNKGYEVDGTNVTIKWTTDEFASAFIDYSKTESEFDLGSFGYNTTTGNSQTVLLSSLDANTIYYFRIRSSDENNNEAIDSNSTAGYSFTTEAAALACPTVSCGGGGGSSKDTSPPKISNIAISKITSSSATVSWTTNEKGYSMTKYGRDNEYGKVNGSYEDNTKTHTVILTNLDLDTSYNYKVATADSSGNLAQSDNLTFKTLSKDNLTDEEKKIEQEQQQTTAEEIQTKIEELISQGMDEETVRTIISKATQPPAINTEGPVLSDITNSSVKVSWITDRKSNSVIRFKAKEEAVNPEDSTSLRQFGDFTKLETNHSTILSGLLSGTTYQYQVQSSDILGNTGKSQWKEFTTQIVPSIYDVIVSEISLNSVVINWKTNIVSSSKVEYGKTIDYNLSEEDKDNLKVAKHILKLNNLQSGVTYHYRVRGIDDKGNALVSDDYTFTTFTLPQIKTDENPIKEIGETTVNISWETNVQTDSTIKYTDSKTNITKKQGEDTLASIHNFTLKGLTPGKKYILQIQGRDAYGNQAISPEFEITTPQDTTSPQITQLRTETAVSSGKSETVQTIISYKTNEPTTSQILWEEGISGEGTPLNSNKKDADFTTSHITVITSFKSNTVYRFRVRAEDKSGNISESQDFTILIPEKKKSVIQIIIGNFENTFSWMKNIGN